MGGGRAVRHAAFTSIRGSPAYGALTIMWMWFLEGWVGKILKTVSTEFGLAANFEKSDPRDSICSTRVSSGWASMASFN